MVEGSGDWGKFSRQERVIMVQMEGNKAPRTKRGLAA